MRRREPGREGAERVRERGSPPLSAIESRETVALPDVPGMRKRVCALLIIEVLEAGSCTVVHAALLSDPCGPSHADDAHRYNLRIE
jgi:hypothetical protein